jgi:methionine-rich copper-binding protein CopC
MRIPTVFAGAALLVLLASVAAHAHALLDRADPRVGSVVTEAPRQVLLSFTQDIEAAFSAVEVTDASGQRVDEGTPRVEGNVMSVPLRSLSPGIYRVKWRVLSVDTHATEGAFSFEVRR